MGNNDAKIIIGTEIDDSNLDKQLDDVKEKIDDKDLDIDIGVKDINKIGDLLEDSGEEGSSFLKGMSDAFSSGIMSLGKWLLIIGAIVLGIILIIDTFKNIIGTNEEVREQWEEIKNTIANMISLIGQSLMQILSKLLLPVLQFILNVIEKIVQYVGYLLKAWFGIDIFAQSTNNSLNKASKNASKLRKTIAGFDEMNILNDNTKGAGSNIADNINNNLLKPLSETPAWLQILGDFDKMKIGIDWLLSKSDEIHTKYGGLIGFLYDLMVEKIDGIYKYFSTSFKGIKEIFNLIIKFIKQVFAGDWEGAWETIKKIFSTMWNTLLKKSETTFKVTLPGKMYELGVKVGEALNKALKWSVNIILTSLEGFINSPIRTINMLTGAVNDLFGTKIGKLSLVKLPRLAKGGIINQPGRGVPVGSAIAGESGREGVIPLTDSQQMELLGEAIGKYITVNANIVNTMNGRVISRELQKVQNDSNFAYNR